MVHSTTDGLPRLDTTVDRLHLLTISSPDENALFDDCETLCDELMDGNIQLSSIACDLSAKHVYEHRAFVVTRDIEIDTDDFITGQVKTTTPPRICLLFSGQGSQWPQMGKDLLSRFKVARKVIAELDEALHQIPEFPSWSIAAELTEPRSVEHYSQPEIAQTLTTAVQLALVAVYKDWGVQFETVIGHSSGEIAAASAAGLLSRTEAIVTAYYCGWTATKTKTHPNLRMGMLAAGVSSQEIEELLPENYKQVTIACYNGPRSVTLSGPMEELEKLKSMLTDKGRQTSLLNVPVPYHHHKLMAAMGDSYETKLRHHLSTGKSHHGVSMISTVTTEPVLDKTNAAYWKDNIIFPVRFEDTLIKTLSGPGAPTVFIEVGPTGSLAGAILDTKNKLGTKGTNVAYYKSMNRGKSSITPMFQVAGCLFVDGVKLDLARVNI